VTNSKGL